MTKGSNIHQGPPIVVLMEMRTTDEPTVVIDEEPHATCLIASGLKPVRFERANKRARVVFVKEEADPITKRFLGNEEIMVNFKDVVYAQTLWRSVLQLSFQQARESVI